MRKGALFACVGVLPLLVGCNTLDAVYVREGIGTNLSSTDLVEVTQIQDLYVGEICRQAGLRVSLRDNEVYCDEVSMRRNEWATFVQAGMNDIDRRCDAYLAWLDNKRRWREPILKQLATTAATTAAVMGLAGASTKAISIAGAAFGFAQDTFLNVNTRLITEIDHTVIQSVVLDNQSQFRVRIANENINNRPAAIYLLRNYLRICMPFSIEMSINNTVTTYHRSGAAGLRSDPILVRPTEVARITATKAISTGERVGVRIERGGGPPEPAYGSIIAEFDPDLHTTAYVRNVLSKLCVRANEISVTPRMNSLIRAYQYYIYEGSPDFKKRVTGKLTRDEMKALNGDVAGTCPGDRANFYEWQDTRFGSGIASSGLVTLVNEWITKKRPDVLKLPTSEAVSRDKMRDKISILKAGMQADLFLNDSALAQHFTPDFVGIISK